MRHTTQDYKDYMASPEWQAKRQSYIDSGRSVACHKCSATKEIHFHHRTYVRFKDEALDDLVPLCRKCHFALHSAQRRRKMSVEEATAVFFGAKRKPRKRSRAARAATTRKRRARRLTGSSLPVKPKGVRAKV